MRSCRVNLFISELVWWKSVNIRFLRMSIRTHWVEKVLLTSHFLRWQSRGLPLIILIHLLRLLETSKKVSEGMLFTDLSWLNAIIEIVRNLLGININCNRNVEGVTAYSCLCSSNALNCIIQMNNGLLVGVIWGTLIIDLKLIYIWSLVDLIHRLWFERNLIVFN